MASKQSALSLMAGSTVKKTTSTKKKTNPSEPKKEAKKTAKVLVSGLVDATGDTSKKSGNELQDTLRKFIADSLKTMMDTFCDLSPTKQWETIVQLLPYATPKMASTDINANMDFDPLASQLGQLANEIAPDEDDDKNPIPEDFAS